MIRIILTLQCILILHCYNLNAQWTPDNGNGTFKNPLLWGDWPDPDFIRVGDEFYFVSTSMHYVPGCPILKSKDLVNWEMAGYAVDKYDEDPRYNLQGGQMYLRGSWAATIRHHKGLFYVGFCTPQWDKEKGQFSICTAKDIKGPWKRTIFPEYLYDPGLFFDEDGKVYVVHGQGKLYVTELAADALSVIGKPREIWNKSIEKPAGSTAPYNAYGMEGSHVYKINGYYYITCPAGGTEGWQVCLRSKNIYGPYESKIIIQDESSYPNNGLHQGGMVQLKDGTWWFIIMQDRGPIGRVPHLVPVQWIDNWPMLGKNGNGKGVVNHQKPIPGNRISVPATSDEFNAKVLGLQWQWNHNPDDSKWSLKEKPGFMRLRASLANDLTTARNTLTQRVQGPTSTGTVELDVSQLKDGNIAGFGIFQSPYAYIAIRKEGNGKSLVMVNNGKVVDSIQHVTQNRIWIRASASHTDFTASFSYSFDNARFIPFGNQLKMGLGYDWTANRFALFNFSTKKGGAGGYADFNWFRFTGADMDVAGKVAHVAEPPVAGRWTAWSGKPATAWQDAFVTGNGRHGTMVTGSAGNTRLVNVHEELFLRAWDRRKIAVANIAGLLPEVRKLCDSGQFTAAADLACKTARTQLTAMGAPQAWPNSPHPAFDLNVKLETTGNISGYRRQLNLETGESQIRYNDNNGGVQESVFSSRANNVNVWHARRLNGKKLTARLRLDETPGRTGKIDGVDVSKAFRSITTKAESPGWLSYHAQYANDSGGYEGLARITTKGGKIIASGNELQIKDADEIMVVIRITPLEFGSTTQQAFTRNELSRFPNDYESLVAPHAKLHGEMFRRLVLDLGCAEQWTRNPTEKILAEAQEKGPTAVFLEQMHAMGRYLLISSSGKYPPPLQGIWGGGWTPAWNGGFVFDSNVNLAISAISQGDLPECAESYFGYVERLLPAWRLNAHNYLGCRGFLVPHYSDPETGYLNHFDTGFPWMYWPSGAGWNLMPFYEHGMITGDTAFLRNRVLPLYIEMAEFYEDYLVKEKDGYYHISPGISPENNLEGHETTLSKDATIDIAVAREVFDHLLKLGKLFGLDPGVMSKWKSYHDNLIPYRINEDGALAEWIPNQYRDNYNHRHNSHLYPVFPGTEFLQQGTRSELLNAAREALTKRFKYDTESAHGLIHIALMAARLHDTTKVSTNLDRFARRNYVYNGLVTSHNPEHEIYNLDAVLSLPRLLYDLLVFSQPGRLELLPACPKDFPAGKLSGMRIHNGHKLDISWKDGQLVSATIYPAKNDKVEIVLGNRVKTIEVSSGVAYTMVAPFPF